MNLASTFKELLFSTTSERNFTKELTMKLTRPSMLLSCLISRIELSVLPRKKSVEGTNLKKTYYYEN